ncbi:hypothetical protein AALP_AA4G016400 [Arabis alpina]|uniref:HRDC domain-containing protein n=1 Tax=Arabis alpina TaxID=50452 RepID=A0A087H0I1_ARAAL|nr:hypothetical protein AALP_AA4G016400 [Arabis alpina]
MSEESKLKMKSSEALIDASFPATLSKLSWNSLTDFQELKRPIDEKTRSLLKTIGDFCGKSMKYADGDDWLVNVNDDILKRIEIDAEKKAKVSFHIPTLKKPQEEYNILVNNANIPFEHLFLERSEDTLHFIHPLEKLSVMDFVDPNITETKPVKPLPLEGTAFKLVERVKDLDDLAAKLSCAHEFSVDLEHNQYRSFQGLTCLMQISTRTEDYIVDTFKLWDHIGPYLREFFKDPKKKKVMHGADRDIIWLQRDFGIYVCNLFDTGQASRVLKLERNSLEFLLKHYCGVAANKQYQNADWRIRPLPDVMTRYAREDTHYLLYIYDLMRIDLHKMAKEVEQSDSPLTEVYKRSYDVCTQLYEKELLTGNSYLHLYGVQAANFNAVQLSIVAGLCEWRDLIARSDDESTGYVLPNKTLLEIAKEMPINVGKLRRLLKSKHIYIDRNIDAVVSVIRRSMQNAAAFEPVVQSLKECRHGTVLEKSLKTTAKDRSREAVASSPSLKKFLQVESNVSGVSTTGLYGSGKVCVDALKTQSRGFGAFPSKRKFGRDNKEEEEVKVKNKVSKFKRDEVIIMVDDDDDESDEETLETDDRVTEIPFKGTVQVTQERKKTCDSEIIVLDDDDSDTDLESSEDEGISEKQGRFMTLKRGFLNT